MTEIKRIIAEFKKEVKELYGDKFKNIILYGSWARNEASEESDIDLSIVLKGSITPGKEIDRMIDIITDINLDNGVLVSVYPVSDRDYDTLNSPLLVNLRMEGIVV